MADSELVRMEEQQKLLINGIKEKNWQKVLELLKKFKLDVNLTIENILENGIDAPILLAAIDEESSGLSRILVQDFGANVNQTISIDGRQSTFLIFLLSFRPK